jgi:hypothetical protein
MIIERSINLLIVLGAENRCLSHIDCPPRSGSGESAYLAEFVQQDNLVSQFNRLQVLEGFDAKGVSQRMNPFRVNFIDSAIWG